MKHWRDMFLVTGASMILACGCDRPRPVAQPATTAPTSAPTTEPDVPETQRANALMNISGHSTVFPAARLRIERRDDDRLTATVFSDDPREALRDNYTGNSFYIKMDLDIDDPADIEQTQWHYQAPSAADREDSPYGIFLAGHNTQLQPYDVRARFRKEASGAITVFLAGQFQVVETTKGPAKMVPVAAELLARVDKIPTAKK